MSTRTKLRSVFMGASQPLPKRVTIAGEECLIKHPTLRQRERWLELSEITANKGEAQAVKMSKMQAAAAILLVTDTDGTSLFGLEDLDSLVDSPIGSDFDTVSKMAMAAFNPETAGVNSVGNALGGVVNDNGGSSLPTDSAAPLPS